jgi:DHA1 family bicyclomycin/chloramphenicol resistance-like MFS transporter
MTKILQPSLWLITLIAGLPQLSETVYTPSLPEIAKALMASESMVEYTLTIYLFGFAVGALFWGKLSDKYGRKPCILLGIMVFMLGCLGCYCSTDISMLMISRLIQAFGGSMGSVMAQSITRDAFHGPALGKAYAVVGSALAVFPAIGPVIGGLIAEHSGWQNIFLFLSLCAFCLSVAVQFSLEETHHESNRQAVSILDVSWRLIRDRKVMAFCLIVGAGNGIGFSYFAEASFVLIKMLGLSPAEYGSSFIFIAGAGMCGGLLSKYLHNYYSSREIMSYGVLVMVGATSLGVALAIINHMYQLSSEVMIVVIIFTQMIITFGGGMVTTNSLALALVDYKWCVGTASSLFGFAYYCVTALVTLFMGMLHNGTLLPMPLYFFGVTVFVILVERLMLRK